MKKFKKIFMFSVLCLFAIFFVSCSQNGSSDIDKNSLEYGAQEQQQNYEDDEFTPDIIIVSIKQKYSSQVFTMEDFAGVELEKVECLTEYAYERYSDGNYPENFHHMYSLTLKVQTKENVLAAIKILEQLDFVNVAGPNYIMSFPDTFE